MFEINGKLYNISYYNDEPVLWFLSRIGKMSIEELEDVIMERFNLLNALEPNTDHLPCSDEWIARMRERLESVGLGKMYAYIDNQVSDKKLQDDDTLSYYMACMAAGSENSPFKDWLLDMEMTLFKWKATLLGRNIKHQKAFIHQDKLPYVPVPFNTIVSELFEHKHRMKDCLWYSMIPDFCAGFVLAAPREVFFRGGWVFVPHYHIASVMTELFRLRNQGNMRSIKVVIEERFREILKNVREKQCELLKSASGRLANVPDIEDLAELGGPEGCFPACAQRMWHHLTTKNHLGHYGREQLILFLKGIGLNLEQQLELWKKHMRLDDEEFKKRRYEYYIRWQYGVEGSRSSGQSPSCQQLGQSTSHWRSVNGCPHAEQVGPALAGQRCAQALGPRETPPLTPEDFYHRAMQLRQEDPFGD